MVDSYLSDADFVRMVKDCPPSEVAAKIAQFNDRTRATFLALIFAGRFRDLKPSFSTEKFLKECKA